MLFINPNEPNKKPKLSKLSIMPKSRKHGNDVIVHLVHKVLQIMTKRNKSIVKKKAETRESFFCKGVKNVSCLSSVCTAAPSIDHSEDE